MIPGDHKHHHDTARAHLAACPTHHPHTLVRAVERRGMLYVKCSCDAEIGYDLGEIPGKPWKAQLVEVESDPDYFVAKVERAMRDGTEFPVPPPRNEASGGYEGITGGPVPKSFFVDLGHEVVPVPADDIPVSKRPPKRKPKRGKK